MTRARNRPKGRDKGLEQADGLVHKGWLEMVRFAGLTPQARHDEARTEGHILPRMVDRVVISKGTSESLGSAAQLTFDPATKVHKRTWIQEFMNIAVRHGVKKVADGDYECPPLAPLLAEVKVACDTHRGPYWHYLPVHLFRDSELPSFEIGPVQFIRGAEIPEFVASHRGSQQSRGNDATDMRVLSEYDWVAAIEIPISDIQRGHDRAKRIVKLALLGLAILIADDEWPVAIRVVDELVPAPISRRFAESRGSMFSGTYKHLPGVALKPGFGAQFLRDCAEHLHWLGACLAAYTDEAGLHATIQERWLSALYWYGLGCDQDDDFAAVVNFGAALDTVLGDGNERGPSIKQSMAALFKKQGREVFVECPRLTLDAVVDRVYGEGRSRVIHGGIPTLSSDLVDLRQLGRNVTRVVILELGDRLRTYVGKHRFDDWSVFRRLLLEQGQPS
jgi:hypothetical protein